MNAIEAIEARRSIRKFKDEPIPREALDAVLLAATRAPSGKNGQCWRFVVVKDGKKAEMLGVMREGINKRKAEGEETGSAVWTIKVMEQAPVTVFAFLPGSLRPWQPHSVAQTFSDVVDIQAIGAAIQNMLLAACELGLGSLWICDVFYAYAELCAWMGEEGELIAAVSFGYPAEAPEARPRKPMADVVRWL